MKAILCRAFGPPDTLELSELPEPLAGSGEVVVAVEAIGLNFFDTLIIQNKYQDKPPLPFSPGGEIAGRIVACGTDVTGFAPGDRVMGYIGHGGARQRVACPAERLVKLPDSVSTETAAGICVTYGTTIHALVDRARLQPGETLAVLGAAGGVGLAAVEIGKAMGARVIACASDEEKLAFARAHGADEGINYATEDLKNRLKELTGGKGADVIYDPVGGAYAEQALRAIAWQGRFLVIGFAAGDIPKMPLNLVLLKGCDVLGVYWGSWLARDPEGNRATMTRLLDWYADGTLSAHIHATYPLAETAKALADIADRKVRGKAILTV